MDFDGLFPSEFLQLRVFLGLQIPSGQSVHPISVEWV